MQRQVGGICSLLIQTVAICNLIPLFHKKKAWRMTNLGLLTVDSVRKHLNFILLLITYRWSRKLIPYHDAWLLQRRHVYDKDDDPTTVAIAPVFFAALVDCWCMCPPPSLPSVAYIPNIEYVVPCTTATNPFWREQKSPAWKAFG